MAAVPICQTGSNSGT